jgi:hypothetical protein
LRKYIVFGAALLGLGLVPSLSEAQFSPMLADKFMVAGSFDAGLRDGEFWQAAFDHPAGMAISEDGRYLYVADEGSHALRSIDLDNRNRVSTLFILPRGNPADIEEVALQDGKLYFLPSNQMGLWRVPLSGGRPSLMIPSSAPHQISPPLAWPKSNRLFWINFQKAELAFSDSDGPSQTAGVIQGFQDGPNLARLMELNGALFLFDNAGRLAKLTL